MVMIAARVGTGVTVGWGSVAAKVAVAAAVVFLVAVVAAEVAKQQQ